MIINEHFVMTHAGIAHRDFMADSTTYHYHHHTVFMVTSGEADVVINQKECKWRAGDIIMISSDTILEMTYMSPTFDMMAICIEEEEVRMRGNLIMHTTSSEWNEVIQMAEALWTVARHKPFRHETAIALATAIITDIQCIASNGEKTELEKIPAHERIFNHFRKLVDMHAGKEHNISFYAQQLCVTSNYLSKVVSSVSGITAMQWINRAVVIHAKVLLKTTDMMTSKIADLLNFPDLSSFSRFFKRETGVTPREFRAKD